MPTNVSTANVLAVILAGGLSKRMQGSDKVFMTLQNRPLIEHVIIKLKKLSVEHIVINANRNNDKLAQFGYPVIQDLEQNYSGPLAGILAAMHWAKKNRPDIRYIFSVACDTPFFPDDLLKRLMLAIAKTKDTELSIAACPQRLHAVFSVHKISLYQRLKEALIKNQTRKIMLWAEKCNYQKVCFTDNLQNGQSPFFNINTKEELNIAQGIIKQNYE